LGVKEMPDFEDVSMYSALRQGIHTPRRTQNTKDGKPSERSK